jgi:hypothetical protein
MGQARLTVLNIAIMAANIAIAAMNVWMAVERRRLDRSREARAEYLAEQASRPGLDGLSSRCLDHEASPSGKFLVG